MEKIRKDIDILKEIHKELDENYSDDEWDLCSDHQHELCRITGMEEHDWDENVLGHYIDGMQRALSLQTSYKKFASQDSQEKQVKPVPCGCLTSSESKTSPDNLDTFQDKCVKCKPNRKCDKHYDGHSLSPDVNPRKEVRE